MKDVYILGAGGFGREVYGWLLDLPEFGRDMRFGGFLDDDPNALDGFKLETGIVGSIRDYESRATHVLVCGIGRVDLKRRVCQPLREAGAEFLTVVHPTAVLGRNVRLGTGVVLCPRVTLTCDIEVGDFAMINCHSSAGHDVRIGAWTTISAHCDLTGHTRIDEEVFMGSGASVIPGKRVGRGAVVGAGSTVIRSVAAGKKVFGNPAREFA